MSRRQVLILVAGIELLVALILVYNYGYFRARSRSQAPVDSAATGQNPPATLPPLAPTTAPALIPELSPMLLRMFMPLPAEATPGNYQMTGELIALGRTLWYDPRLSINQQQSCNTCHPLDRYGTDALPVSLGHDGRPVKRNAQTVYNAAFHIAQFWDGRSPSVEEQAKGPIMSQAEMGMHSPAQVEAVLRSIPGYVPLFTAAFPGDANPFTFDNTARAIAAFERRLITPSRFDRFLAGDYTQLTAEEQQGLATFISVGCITCHVGVTVGGLMFRKLGEIEPYQTDDLGRFAVTGLETDRFVFKVQSLRNIARTAPYLHDGSIQTLEEMVRLMARHQLGKQLTADDVAAIVTFLNSLTGDLPADYIIPPPLPESGPDTQLAYQTN